jgi:hypothetical protein
MCRKKVGLTGTKNTLALYILLLAISRALGYSVRDCSFLNFKKKKKTP